MATLIPADETLPIRNVVVNGLESMQKFIGGYIEEVNVEIEDGRKAMLVNEEGLLMGLPFNKRASTMVCELLGVTAGNVNLVGDALILEVGREYD
jgi:hypothetical protein